MRTTTLALSREIITYEISTAPLGQRVSGKKNASTQRGYQASRLAQDSQPRTLQRAAGIVIADPFARFDQTSLLQLTDARPPFGLLRQQDGNLLARNLQIKPRNIRR